jgi:hypothetical protein
MIDDIFKRVDDLSCDAIPDAWVLSPTQSLTVGDVRHLVAQVRSLMLALESKKRDELIRVAAQIYAARPATNAEVGADVAIGDAVDEARQLIGEVNIQLGLDKITIP